MPEVSVVIASYNHEKYIGQAIQSVLDQTYQDFELIIVDDGSTDNSVEIIRTFTDTRIRLICFDTNQGASAAAERLIREADGKYIAVLNSDDMFVDNKLEKQVAYLKQHAEIGAVFSFAQIIDEEGNDFLDDSHFYAKVFKQANRNRYQWLREFFYHGNSLCHPSLLIRKECYQTIGTYDYRYYQLPDFDFWIRLCFKYEIHIIPEPLTKFRVRANEANASGDNYQNQIRYKNELVSVLERFRLIASCEEFQKIFPDYQHEVADFDVECALALLCMDSNNSIMHHSFGLNLLFKLLSDPERKNKLEQNKQFSYRQLYDISKRMDIFSVCLVDVFSPEVYVKYTHTEECERYSADIKVFGNRVKAKIDFKNKADIEAIYVVLLQGWSCNLKIIKLDSDLKNITINDAAEQQEYALIDINPTLMFKGDFQDASILELTYEIKLFDLQQILTKLKQYIQQNNQLFIEKEQLIIKKEQLSKVSHQLQQEIHGLQEKQHELEQHLETIYNSKGYKVLLKLREVREKVEKILRRR